MNNKQELQQLKAAYQSQLLGNIEVTINTGEVDDIFDKLEELASNLREAYKDNVGDLNQKEDWIGAIQKRLMCVSYILPYYENVTDSFNECTKPGDASQIRTSSIVEEVTYNEPVERDGIEKSVDVSIPYPFQNHKVYIEHDRVTEGSGDMLGIGLRTRAVPLTRYNARRVLKESSEFSSDTPILVYNENFNRTTTTLGELLMYGDIVTFYFNKKRMVGYRPNGNLERDIWIRAFYVLATGELALSNVPLTKDAEYGITVPRQPRVPTETPVVAIDIYVYRDDDDIRVTRDTPMGEVNPMKVAHADSGRPLGIGYHGGEIRYCNYRADKVLTALKTTENKLICHTSTPVKRHDIDVYSHYDIVIYNHSRIYLAGVISDGCFYPFYINTLGRVALSRNAYSHPHGRVMKMIS